MTDKLIEAIEAGSFDPVFKRLYLKDFPQQADRYKALIKGYAHTHNVTQDPIRFFSSPGRTEIGGNHTDHQRGRVLAAAVQLDAVGVVQATDDGVVRVYSVGYGAVEVDSRDLEAKKEEENTTKSLIRGILARLVELGYTVGGFNCYCDSYVPVGSGLSSSAAFENLITTILSGLYNGGEIAPVEIAQIGQYAENHYFGKPSGLMDQAASAVGGMVTLDFEDASSPKVEFIQMDLAQYGYSMCIVNTDADHADLTSEYAAIFNENQLVSEYFGKEVLRQVAEKDFYAAVPEIRRKYGDRVVLRAMHFFDENQRVKEQVDAIRSGDFETFKQLVIDSGESSFTRLQNVYSSADVSSQPISLALEYSRKLLAKAGGAWRIHGGGFAGTILAFLPDDKVLGYKAEMDRIFGENATQVLTIRKVGSCEVLAV